MVIILDGFYAHASSLNAICIYNDCKIIIIKEEADEYYANQSYDQHITNHKKILGQAILLMLWQKKSATRGLLDQWNLFLVGVKYVNSCTKEIWQS